MCCPASYSPTCPQAQASATCIGFDQPKDEQGCVMSCTCIRPAAGNSGAAAPAPTPAPAPTQPAAARGSSTRAAGTATWAATTPTPGQPEGSGGSGSADAVIWAIVIAALVIVAVMFLALRKRRAAQRGGAYDLAGLEGDQSMNMLQMRKASTRNAYARPVQATEAGEGGAAARSVDTNMDDMAAVSSALNLPVRPVAQTETNDEYLEVTGTLQGTLVVGGAQQGESSTDTPVRSQPAFAPLGFLVHYAYTTRIAWRVFFFACFSPGHGQAVG